MQLHNVECSGVDTRFQGNRNLDSKDRRVVSKLVLQERQLHMLFWTEAGAVSSEGRTCALAGSWCTALLNTSPNILDALLCDCVTKLDVHGSPSDVSDCSHSQLLPFDYFAFSSPSK